MPADKASLCGPPIGVFVRSPPLEGYHAARPFGHRRSTARGNSANFLQRCEKRPWEFASALNTPELLHFNRCRRDQDAEKFELVPVLSLNLPECRRQLPRS